MQYLSFQYYLNIPFSIRLERGWRLVFGKSSKKNENTVTEIDATNRPNCYDFKPLPMRYITIHRVFEGHFPLEALLAIIPLFSKYQLVNTNPQTQISSKNHIRHRYYLLDDS